MAEFEKQEFLSPHQCFIVYDKLTKQIAISIRNRLSEKGVKCVIWNEDQFVSNEIRLSNYNRLLIFSKKIADEYLANPSLKSKQLTDYVVYKREGRVASIVLKTEKIDYAVLYKMIAAPIEKLISDIKALDSEKQEKIKTKSPEEIAEAITIIQAENNILALPQGDSMNKEEENKNNETVRLLKEYGLAAGACLLPRPLAILCGYKWFSEKKEDEKCKQLFLFEAVEHFEKELLDDFVNAK